jgi:hypothetical protein
MARLFIGRKPLELPARRCSVDDAQGEARRRNPPFVVAACEGAPRFNVRRRVFLVTEDGLRVECEGEGELRLACKLVVADHNRWQDAGDDTLECVRETEEMERQAEQQRAAEEEPSSGEDEPKEDEDISIEEWGQLGYKWFKKEDVLYI